MQTRTVGDDELPKKRGRGRPRLEEPSAEYLAKRDELVATAAALFHEKGYDSGTIVDLADAFGMRKSSIYHYVQSKEHLLHMVLERAIDLALTELEGYMSIEDPVERLESIIRHQAKMVVGDISLFSVFFGDRPHLDPAFESSLRERERRYFSIVRSAVQAASEAGALGDVDPTYATHCLLGMTIWPYRWFVSGRDDADALADHCVAFMFGSRQPSKQRRGPAGTNAKKAQGTPRKT